MNRILTPEENAYVQILCDRILHIQRKHELLRHLPLKATFEPMGLSVMATLCLLVDCAGWTEQEMLEVLDA